MKKYFCDVCGDEITRDNQFEHKELQIKNYKVTLTLEEPVADEDCVCLYCILKEVNKLDKRDRPAAG